ncbi:NUDIX hydrolase [Nonomuraea fuscirosea]
MSNLTKTCDNTSVGAIILDAEGRMLVFDRNTDPPGVAGPAGHIDDHGTADDAVIAEVAEEVGLTVASLDLVVEAWRANQCRRLPGPAGVGHYWVVYRAGVTGELTPSARETRNARWLSQHELQDLTLRTLAYARGLLTAEEFRAQPGVEPVWTAWLSLAGLVPMLRGDLALINQVANMPFGQEGE